MRMRGNQIYKIISNADSVASKLPFSLTVKCNEHSGCIHHSFFVLILDKSKKILTRRQQNEAMEVETERNRYPPSNEKLS